MWQPAPPPPPVGGEEFLSKLAAYYRSLVEYHQRAASEAHLRLSYVEALLDSTQEIEALVVEKKEEQKNLLSTTLSDQKNVVAREEQETESSEQESEFISEREKMIPNQKQILDLLNQNRGKILHLDYIVRQIVGQEEETVKVEVANKLFEGEKAGFWASVPDSPGCWTIDLSEIPDLSPSKPKVSSRKTASATTKKRPMGARIPKEGRMRDYPTLTAAVRACLKKRSPHSCDTQIILDWIYPEGLSDWQRKEVRTSVSDILNKGKGKEWERVGSGRYVWLS